MGIPKRTPAEYAQLLGCIPDTPDHRDFKYKLPAHLTAVKLPDAVDLRLACPPIGDQGNLGSCTAWAILAAARFDQIQMGQDFDPSELFLYYCERVVEKTTNKDNGAMIRTGVSCLNKQGVCIDAVWPYNIGKFKTAPSATAYSTALKHKSSSYARVNQDLTSLKTVLAGGKPFIFGFVVYGSFISNAVAMTGTVPMPKKGESILGGHAVCAVGYDDSTQRFICRNSWGTDWGMAGYFTMPYAYITNSTLTSDIWVINSMIALSAGKPVTTPLMPIKK